MGAAPAACNAEKGSRSQAVTENNYHWHVAEHGPELQGTQVTERFSPLPKNSPKPAHLNLNRDLTGDMTLVLPPGFLPELQTAAIDNFTFHSAQVTGKNKSNGRKTANKPIKMRNFILLTYYEAKQN